MIMWGVGIYLKIMNKIKKINIKRVVIILLVIISILSIIYIISSSNNKKITINKQFISPPKIENYFGNNLNITQDLNKSDFNNFPKTLSYLKQVGLSPFTPDEMNKIATSFDFTISPLEFNDIKEGKIYIWNSDRYSLIIYSKSRKIELTPAFNPTNLINTAPNKQLSDEDYKNLTMDILVEKLGINKGLLKFSNIIYLKNEEGLEFYRKTTKEESQITQVNMYSTEGSLPIFTTNPQESQIIVQFTKDGEILNIKASLYSGYKQSEIEYNIKDYSEVVKTINDSVLVSLNDSNVNLPDLKPEEIESINIKNISLVYLQESLTSDMLQPVFLLEGTAKVKEFDNEITASLYLSAYSKN